jgi:hypothetical protein
MPTSRFSCVGMLKLGRRERGPRDDRRR